LSPQAAGCRSSLPGADPSARVSKQFLERLRQDKQDLLEKNRYGHAYNSLGPVWMGDRLSSSVAPRGYDVVIYDKGGWILNMLRMMMSDVRSKNPDARFKAMMHDFCQTYANRAASTEDFKAFVEKYMMRTMDLDGNHRMDWFFNQYVYGTGIPDYSFSYQISSAGNGKWRITGKVLRSGVSGKWEDILPLYGQVGKREGRTGWIVDRQPTTRFSFVMAEKPDKLSLNDSEEILANIHQ
jgi:aminopeptidase N